MAYPRGICAEPHELVQDWLAGELSIPSVSVSGAAAHRVMNDGASVSVNEPTSAAPTVVASIV